ncbi:MAG: glycosyltransferase family 4 protein [Epsilonproteobacteria bacterium]|nr:glycosyltransferase family 4 protein [Campylobacterota bacterium]
MKTQKPKIVIYLYNRFFDPLIQSNFWLYIKDYLENENNPYQFHLITYENPDFPLTKEQEELVRKWKEQGLEWTPLIWHPGKELKNKFLDLFDGLKVTMKLRAKGYKYIITLGSVAGTYAYVFSKLTGLKQYLYQYEPHSEYAIDNKMWSKDSLQYKISHYLERKAALNAKVIASGTIFMQERVEKIWKSKAKFFRIPTVANDKKFIFNQKERDETRKELGISDDTWVLYYPGKFGDLYYKEEFAYMYKWLKEEEPKFHMLIVTPHTDEEVHELFEKAGVSKEHYTVTHSDYENIHKYHFASDFAIISVPQGPSKKFISNIKVGEYLCAGLPFLINKGVSEDYIYAIEKKVGVVVDGFVEEEIKKAVPKIREYLSGDRDKLRKHCRKVGLEYRGFEGLNKKFKNAVSALVNGDKR